MKYNQYSIDKIKKLVEKGQQLAAVYNSETELAYAVDCTPSEYEFILLGFNNPNYSVPEPEYFYRIGEPREDGYGSYKNSWNFAEDRAEDGVSVVTTAWLNSIKSVFFNTTDEKIAERGVYKIYGFRLPASGGDDESLICPLDWAEKTRIRTRSGLEKAVKGLCM